jgi:hypothetical protein
MKKIIKYLQGIDGWIYLILFFCLMGVLRNILQINYYGFDYSNVAIKVFIAMIMMYGAQTILILMRERKVWMISALQAFFCFYVYEDFTFLPLANAAKMLFKVYAPNMGYGWIYFVNTMIISALFCLELIKTYLLYALTDEPAKKAPARKKADA